MTEHIAALPTGAVKVQILRGKRGQFVVFPTGWQLTGKNVVIEKRDGKLHISAGSYRSAFEHHQAIPPDVSA